MDRAKLIAKGLSEELADWVMSELDGNFVPKSRFNEVNTELKKAKEAISERDGQLETVKKSVGDADELRKQIEQLQKDNKAKDESHSAEIKRIRIESALDKALADAKAKNLKAVKALLELGDAEIGEDGTIKGLDAKIKALKEADVFFHLLYRWQMLLSFRAVRDSETAYGACISDIVTKGI